MALIKSSKYAPDIYKALNGILLLYKPPLAFTYENVMQLRDQISDQLNQYEPRPMAKRLLIEGELDEEKRIVEVPNLADHPLVVGPRYNPWEMAIGIIRPKLSPKMSGLNVVLLGTANRLFHNKMQRSKMVSVYEISGKFGYITDNYFSDGRIIDKSSYKHIRSGKLDAILSKIESSQQERLFDASNVPLNSNQAYELAKAWPSRPPEMARWPVIYKLQCIHLELPRFKLEVAIVNENPNFLGQLCHDIGLMLKSGAHVESIRRIRFGPFKVDDALTHKDWDIQTIIDHLQANQARYDEIHQTLDKHLHALTIRV